MSSNSFPKCFNFKNIYFIGNFDKSLSDFLVKVTIVVILFSSKWNALKHGVRICHLEEGLFWVQFEVLEWMCFFTIILTS